MPDYGGTFTASYDPNLVTQTALTGPPVEYGTGEGGYGFNIDSLLAKVYDWKQRAAAMDYYRQQQGASADAQRQMAALRGSAALQQQVQDRQRSQAQRDQRTAGNVYANQMQNLQGAGGIGYRFTDPSIAAQVMALEAPYRLQSLTSGGSSRYGGVEADPAGMSSGGRPDVYAADYTAQRGR